MSTNGSGNGHDPEDKKIVRFPSLAERDRMRREEREAEERWRAEYRKKSKSNREPFFKFGNVPPFSKYFIASLIAIHLVLYLVFDEVTRFTLMNYLGFVPGQYTGALQWHWTSLISPLAHILIHGSWMHLLFNGIMGLVLGMYFEKMFGARSTIKFFIACTLAGAFAFFIFHPFSPIPVVGASGAISGLFGAFIYMTIAQNEYHPLTQKFGKYGPWPILIFWGLFIVVPGLMGGSSMAWEAHLGGYVCGIAIIMAQKRGLIRLI